MAMSRKLQNTTYKRAKYFSVSRLLLPLALLFCLCVLPANAQSGLKEAQALNSIGLFSGTDQGFELERTPTRAEALVMLLKLTGQAQQAQQENLPHPFTDGGWASPFIGYGYTHKYTSGVSASEFGTSHSATAQQYSVFLLRALGYTINEDYTYEKALPFFLSHAPALTPDGDSFTRGDMAAMSLAALAAPMKDGSGTLAEKLSGQGLFSMEDYQKARDSAVSDSKDAVTVLVYMIASDMESINGCATADLNEMLAANLNDSVNVVLQTGGTKDWKNNWMTDGATQRFQVTDTDMLHLSTLENAPMSQPDTLSNFLRWGVTAYPAQRYMVVFWDHGYGTLKGFGSDEVNRYKALSLGEMSRAFGWTDTHFELAIYSACLMSTVTNAYILQDYADYLLASEELTSLSGLLYTPWLNELAARPDIPVQELSEIITRDYLSVSTTQRWDETTFSLVDLSKIQPVMDEWKGVLAQLSRKQNAKQYYSFGQAVSESKQYSIINPYDQVDLIDFLDKLEQRSLADTTALKEAVMQAVIQCGTSNIDIANGLAVYVPYHKPYDYWRVTRPSLLESGFEEEDLVFFDRFTEDLIQNDTDDDF